MANQREDFKNRDFQGSWEAEYMFVDVRGKIECLLCGDSVAVMKEYNLRRHYETKHHDTYKHLNTKQRLQKVEDLFYCGSKISSTLYQGRICQKPQDKSLRCRVPRKKAKGTTQQSSEIRSCCVKWCFCATSRAILMHSTCSVRGGTVSSLTCTL